MKGKRSWAALGLCLIILLLWIILPGRMRRTWDLLGSGMVQQTTRAAGDYGITTTGPEMNLRAGRYTLVWRASTDGENIIRLVSDNGVDIVPAEITVSPEVGEGEIRFTVYNETDNFRIEADYEQGSFLALEGLTLRGGACTDSLFTLSFLLGIAALLLLVSSCTSFRRQAPLLALLIFAAILASLPCLKDNLNLGDDLNFHLERLSNLTQGLLSGQFPVRLGTYMNKGFGAIISVFYPETFLYPAALMILMGSSIQYAVHVLFIGINLLTAFAAYHLGKRIWADEAAGAVCGALYTLAIYRLTDLYTRSAVGEALAMAFLPLFALAFYEVLLGDKRRWPSLALSAAALCHSHLITTALVALLSALLALLLLPRLVRERRFSRVLLALTGAALLCLCLAAPMLTYLAQGITTDVLQKSLSGNAMAPAQLLSQTGYDLGQKVWDGTLRSRGYEVGLPLQLAAVLCLALLLAQWGEARAAEESRLAAFLLGLGACCLFGASRLCPWDALPDALWNAASFLQFPWRLLMLVDLCFALCGGWAAREALTLDKKCLGGGKKILMVFISIAFCLMCVMPMLTMETRKNHYVYYGRVSEQGMIFLDYALEDTDSRTLDDRAVQTEDAEAGPLRRAGTNLSLEVTSSRGGSVTLPVFAFEGWAAELSGQRLETQRSAQNRLRILLPAGGEGTLRVWFEGKAVWRVCDALSLLALTALLMLSRRERRKRA